MAADAPAPAPLPRLGGRWWQLVTLTTCGRLSSFQRVRSRLSRTPNTSGQLPTGHRPLQPSSRTKRLQTHATECVSGRLVPRQPLQGARRPALAAPGSLRGWWLSGCWVAEWLLGCWLCSARAKVSRLDATTCTRSISTIRIHVLSSYIQLVLVATFTRSTSTCS